MTEAASVQGAQLKPAQRRALDALASGDRSDLTRAAYQELTGVSRSQAAYDLADLVETGALVRVGAGRATRYRLAPAQQSGRRRWTSDRIRAELEAFCSGRTSWPSAGEFKRAGRSDLYVAASRYGGVRFWTAELGLARREASPVEAPRRRWLLRGRVKPALALLLLVVLGAATAAVALLAQQRQSDSPRRASASRSHGGRIEPLGAELRWVRRAAVASRAARATSVAHPRAVPRRVPRVVPSTPARPAPVQPAPVQPAPVQPAPVLVASHPPPSPAKPVAKPAPPAPPPPAPKPKPKPKPKPSSSWPAPLPAP